MAFNLGKALKKATGSKFGKLARGVLELQAGPISFSALAQGKTDPADISTDLRLINAGKDLIPSPSLFPKVPPPAIPPPPAAPRPPPPRRSDPEIQEAGADQRALFRRRGRRTTVLTRGGSSGDTQRTAGTLGTTRRAI